MRGNDVVKWKVGMIGAAGNWRAISSAAHFEQCLVFHWVLFW